MTLREIADLLDAKVLAGEKHLGTEVKTAFAADLMSDVLAFTHEGTLLMSGLTNPQVVRTAEMAGIRAIVFVRGKIPPPETVALAEDKGIPLLASKYTMFETCGRAYAAGLPSCGLFELTLRRWRDAFEEE